MITDSNRKTLRRWAALLLVVWLIAAGSAFAQSCSTLAMVGCDECCLEGSPPAITADRFEVKASQAPAVVPVFHAIAPDVQAPGPSGLVKAHHIAPLRGPPPRIPIVFLRLAL